MLFVTDRPALCRICCLLCGAAGLWVIVGDCQRSHVAGSWPGVCVQVRSTRGFKTHQIKINRYLSVHVCWLTMACLCFSFGEHVQLLHPFHQPFNDESGARILRLCQFQQKKTRIAQVGGTACQQRCIYVTEIFSERKRWAVKMQSKVCVPTDCEFTSVLYSFWKHLQKCFWQHNSTLQAL